MKSLQGITVKQLFIEFGPMGVIQEAQGNTEIPIRRLAPVESAEPGDLVFIDKQEFVQVALMRKPGSVVTSHKLAGVFVEAGIPVLISPHVPLAHALIKQKYGARDFAESWKGIHPSAVVHPTAVIGSHTVLEPLVVVGARVKVGENCRIMSGAVIEDGAVIGNNVVIHPRVVVGYDCQIGHDVVIEASSVIGSQGFGFAQDQKRKSYQIPQTGTVIIEDRVRIGAGCCIDRATYRETRIGAGTKLDNLCHVAHNVQIGQDCLLTAMLCVAGSTKIGDRVITSGQTGILDHMEIGNDVVLVHRAGVSKDVLEPGVYAGIPTLPLQDYMKNQVVWRSGVELKKRVQEIEKALEEIKKS
ncbi:MAG: UDP-3-O-(3-hydroxymyristoyl)glucosamine N-acyltransferase [Oligoflexia bacterium]|nr:UDP-3-O-(3-hydroxymyristoyl)glucosamine N-acyltransferase [Oligoflexia bacterium]